MKKIRLSKTNRINFATFGAVILAYAVFQFMSGAGMLSSTIRGQLVPICAYVTMALSLNLTVGVLGELSLGHAGFMSVGAFAGAVAAAALPIDSDPLRLAASMVIAALAAAAAGTLVGIPVLRLNGDYLAIVTLAFGQIIKSIMENLYIGIDARGLHFSFLENRIIFRDGGRMLLNGAMGVNGIAKISSFTAGFVLVMLVLAVIFNLVDSRAGRAIMALRDNRIAAESVGIPVKADGLCHLRRHGGGGGRAVRPGAEHHHRQQVRLQHLHPDPGLRGSGRAGEHVGLHPGGHLPHGAAGDQGHARSGGLPDAGLRRGADPRHAGDQ